MTSYGISSYSFYFPMMLKTNMDTPIQKQLLTNV